MAYLYRLQEHTFQMIWDKSEEILGTWGTCCKRSAKHIVNNKIPSPPPQLPQNEKKWDKGEMLLETSWELEKHLGNSLGTYWEHIGNTLRTIKIQKIQDPTSNFPQKMNWDKSEVLLGTT
jgi:hypothetical protein